jgi:hypothetical protein
MSVYVDDPMHPFGRMIMCHMIADTREELLAMVDQIGVPRKWIQKKDTPSEHFDICKSRREKAIKLGAIAVDGNELVEIIRRKRAAA